MSYVQARFGQCPTGIKSHLFMSAEENASFLIEVNKMIQSLYLDSKQQEISTQEKKEEDDVVHSLAI